MKKLFTGVIALALFFGALTVSATGTSSSQKRTPSSHRSPSIMATVIAINGDQVTVRFKDPSVRSSAVRASQSSKKQRSQLVSEGRVTTTITLPSTDTELVVGEKVKIKGTYNAATKKITVDNVSVLGDQKQKVEQ